MSAYTAAAALGLYTMIGDTTYHGYAVLALANLFHAVRLWDLRTECVGRDWAITYMGLNPLPGRTMSPCSSSTRRGSACWKRHMRYAQERAGRYYEPSQGVHPGLTADPAVLAAAIAAVRRSVIRCREYSFVPHNNLSWHIPLEDLRGGRGVHRGNRPGALWSRAAPSCYGLRAVVRCCKRLGEAARDERDGSVDGRSEPLHVISDDQDRAPRLPLRQEGQGRPSRSGIVPELDCHGDRRPSRGLLRCISASRPMLDRAGRRS